MEHKKRHRKIEKKLKNIKNFLITISLLICSTIICIEFYNYGFNKINIITVYILGVLITSIFTVSKVWSGISSLVSVLIFSFLFTEPIYTFRAYDPRYWITYVITFIASLITSNLAIKIKEQAAQSATVAYRTQILLETNQRLQMAKNQEEIAEATAIQVLKLLGKTTVFYFPESDKILKPVVYLTEEETDESSYLTDQEYDTAFWVYHHNQCAGATTDIHSHSKCLYFAVRNEGNVYGVIGIAVKKGSMDLFDKNILLSVLGESALAMEKEINIRKREEEATKAKNEELRANLLRAISHDLRTPLTSISGNAAILLNNSSFLEEEKKRVLYTDIYDDSMWLINLVENLLAITRIEDGRMNINLQIELVDEVIAESLKHINRKKSEHFVEVIPSDDILLAKMDSRLIVQVIINLVDNAIKYTQPGSKIIIRTEKKEQWIYISIEDNGKGISQEVKEKIFDMFYTENNKVADSRRGLGLGLSLCKSIVLAHGGTIEVKDNIPSGSIFIFTLQAEEVTLNE